MHTKTSIVSERAGLNDTGRHLAQMLCGSYVFTTKLEWVFYLAMAVVLWAEPGKVAIAADNALTCPLQMNKGKHSTT